MNLFVTTMGFKSCPFFGQNQIGCNIGNETWNKEIRISRHLYAYHFWIQNFRTLFNHHKLWLPISDHGFFPTALWRSSAPRQDIHVFVDPWAMVALGCYKFKAIFPVKHLEQLWDSGTLGLWDLVEDQRILQRCPKCMRMLVFPWGEVKKEKCGL